MTTRPQPKPSNANDGAVLAFALGGMAGSLAYSATAHPVPIASTALVATAQALYAVADFLGHPEWLAQWQMMVAVLCGTLVFMAALLLTSRGGDALDRQALRLKARRERRVQAKHERDRFIVH
jgi:peptidoglycan/LPS O-acetylase OafA/YrhL